MADHQLIVTDVFPDGEMVVAYRREGSGFETWPPSGPPPENAISDHANNAIPEGVYFSQLVPGLEYVAWADVDGDNVYVGFLVDSAVRFEDHQYANEGDVLMIVNGLPTWVAPT